MGSEKSTLGDLINATGGSIQTGPFGTKLKASEYTESGVPVISVGEVGFGRIRLHEKTPKVDSTVWKRMPEYLLKTDDIVFGRKGAVERSAHIQPNEDGYFLGSDGIRVRLNPDECDTRFIAYQFQSELHKVWMIQHAAGTTMPSLNEGIIRRIPITLPPLPEQKAIAHILGSLDDKIELNRRMNATLEGMAQAFFKSWFVDFDPVIDNALAAGNPIPDELRRRGNVAPAALNRNESDGAGAPSGSDLAPAVFARTTDGAGAPSLPEINPLFPAAFQQTESMGWIPEGWDATAVSKAISVNLSTKLKKGDVAPFADMKALPTSGYAIDGIIEKSYSGGAKFQNGDVLLAKITPCLENGKTGVVDFLTDDDPVGFGSTEFIVLRGESDLSTAFIACLARDSNFRKHCEQSMIGSSGRQRVHNSCFDSYYLALPRNKNVVSKFNALAVPAFAKTTFQSKESKTLANLRDTLLPMLISGDLQIQEAENLITP